MKKEKAIQAGSNVDRGRLHAFEKASPSQFPIRGKLSKPSGVEKAIVVGSEEELDG